MVDYNNRIVQEDLKHITEVQYPWNLLGNKTILVTGATGMLASYVVFLLIYLREQCHIDLRIAMLCRNRKKAESLYGEFLRKPYLEMLLQDVCDAIEIQGTIDYIFHLAGNASPYFIKTDPVGILKSNLIGTINVLELARSKNTKKIIFASTREVYGKNDYADILSEESHGILDPMDSRSCYPESKRAAESLLKSYYIQYGVHFCTVRIAHSYGPTMNITNDGRVMADLIGDVVAGRDIELKSTGEAERAFIYVTDAILGLFSVLFNGKAGEAYNLSNESEPISIRELAELLLSLRKVPHIKLVFKIPKAIDKSYCSYKRTRLDNSKISRLGWRPIIQLKEGLQRTIDALMSIR